MQVLKILYFTAKADPLYASNWSMVYALKKYADVKYFGPEWPPWWEIHRKPFEPKSIDVQSVIARLYPGDYPDVVLTWGPHTFGLLPSLKNFETARCLRVVWLQELANDIMRPEVYALLSSGGVDLVLKSHDYPSTSQWGARLDKLNVPVEWYPFSVDPEIFYDRKLPRIHDVCNIGQMTTQNYPIRYAMHQMFKDQSEIKYFSSPTKYLLGEEYARAICQSKIFATDCSSHRFEVPKLTEAMGCNALLMCNTPRSADVLGMKAGTNYVDFEEHAMQASDVNRQKVRNTIRYYLDNWESEGRRIAQNGYELVHSRHTHDVRAKDIISRISKYL